MTKAKNSSNGNGALARVHTSIDPYWHKHLVVFPGGMPSEWMDSKADADKIAADFNARMAVAPITSKITYHNTEGAAMSWMRSMNGTRSFNTRRGRADLRVVVKAGDRWAVCDLRTAVNAGANYRWEV